MIAGTAEVTIVRCLPRLSSSLMGRALTKLLVACRE